MNERIKELVVQSGLKVESWMTNPPKPFQILGSAEEFEKFAELIVKECINKCIHVENECRENREHKAESSATLIKLLIKQHFGVEE